MELKIPILNQLLHYFERKAFGVCDWWGEKLGIHPIIIRKFFIYFSFLTMGSPLLLYFLMAFVLEHKNYLKFRQKRKSVWDFK